MEFLASDNLALSFLFFIFAIFFGACLGSFTSAIIPRELNGTKWYALKGDAARSICFSCSKNLGFLELLPIFSYLKQRGLCACGEQKLPIFYFALESFFAVLVVCFLVAKGFSLPVLFLILLMPFFVTAAALNFKGQKISTRILLILIYGSVLAGILSYNEMNVMAGLQGALLVFFIATIFKILQDKYSSKSLYEWDMVQYWSVMGFWLGLPLAGFFIFELGLGAVLWILLKKYYSDKKIFRRETAPYGIWSLFVFCVLFLIF